MLTAENVLVSGFREVWRILYLSDISFLTRLKVALMPINLAFIIFKGYCIIIQFNQVCAVSHQRGISDFKPATLVQCLGIDCSAT
jgi:hypothetical protein